MTSPTRTERAAILCIGIYFILFTWRGLFSYFSHDDLQNLHQAWNLSFFELLKQNLLIDPSYRPFGAFCYKLVYEIFGFHPFPLKVLCYAFSGLNVVLIYRFANRLSGSRRVAIFTLLLYCYHSNFEGFYYNSGSCYDIFCFTFYFGAFQYYLGIRWQGRYPTIREGSIVLLLYLLALNSKEMAVTFPLMLAAWEVICARPVEWRRVWPAPAAASLLTLLYVWTKTRGDSLLNNPAYRPVVTLDNYLNRCVEFIVEAFFRPFFPTYYAAAALLVLLGLALLLRKRYLIWCWLLVVLGILPVAFLSPRGLYAVYIPFLGMAIEFAAALAWVGDRVLRFQSGWVLLLAATAALLASQFLKYRGGSIEYMVAEQRLTKHVADEFRGKYASMPNHGRVLIVNDAFPEDRQWASLFIMRSLYHARDLEVLLPKRLSGPPDYSTFDLVLTFDQGKLIQLRPNLGGGVNIN